MHPAPSARVRKAPERMQAQRSIQGPVEALQNQMIPSLARDQFKLRHPQTAVSRHIQIARLDFRFMVDAAGEFACAVKFHNARHAFTCFCRSASHAKCAIRKPLAVNLGTGSSGRAHRVGQRIRPIDFQALRHTASLFENLLQALRCPFGPVCQTSTESIRFIAPAS